MSSFIMSMLEEGVEVEVPSDLTAIISLLDREVPYFSCNGYNYSVTSGKGTVGKRWELMIKSGNHASGDHALFPVGRVELEKLDGQYVSIRIPPRCGAESSSREEVALVNENDPDGRIFGSFVSQTLNTLQRHRLINLPGALPVE
ncbi:MAG: hypothetical protein BZY81_02895 [SAR202 cluster bacterium Io17-Chloro-G4]|nr:MAG: hypothetical protein BZY81_02895 [SAR202 cluster bacterium Io17-Chloro-G4]